MQINQVVKTPCVGICSTGIGDDVCRGCKRYKHEVIDWNAYSNPQKALIESRLVDFLTSVIRNKFEIVDEGLLQWQLELQPINVPKHRNLYCQLLELVRRGATQIQDPLSYGFKKAPACADVSLKQLVDEVEQEFYSLSVAHYERYFHQFVD